MYDGTKITQKKAFKYLGFLLDAKLSFRHLIDSQFLKLRKTYRIMKFIHNQFSSAASLKLKFFNTYVWPHLFMMSTIYCLLSTTSQNRLSAFYRRCFRLIYCLFQCPTQELHAHFKIPTIEMRFKTSLLKRMKNIQQHEPGIIDYYLQYKHLKNVLHNHYRINPYIKYLPVGRPNKKLSSLIDSDHLTYLDNLLAFVFSRT